MVHIQTSPETEGAFKGPVKLVMSATRKEGEGVEFNLDVDGKLFDTIHCAALLVDKLLAEAKAPADVFCEILKLLEERRKASANPAENNPVAPGMMFASAALSAAAEEHRKQGN